MSSYKVVIEGNVLPGFSSDDVRPRLAALMNRSEEVADRLLSHQASTVKAGVDQATGTRYLNALIAIGVACRVVQESTDIDRVDTEDVAPTRAPAKKDVAADPHEATAPTNVRPKKGPDEKYCGECAAIIRSKAEICPVCGVRQLAPAGWGVHDAPPQLGFSSGQQPVKKPMGLGKLILYAIGGLFFLGVLGNILTVGSSGGPTPRDKVSIVSWSKDMVGFGTIMHIRITLKNDNPVAVKDIIIRCTHYANSGTKIDSNERTLYETLRPGEEKPFDLDMGFVHSQAADTRCGVQGVTT